MAEKSFVNEVAERAGTFAVPPEPPPDEVLLLPPHAAAARVVAARTAVSETFRITRTAPSLGLSVPAVR
jgi:hypothetical protein